MGSGIETINWPSWISAICAVIAFILSIIAILKSQKFHLEHALVSSDGNVMSHKGFNEYGLNVKHSFVPISDDRKNDLVPEYIIEFS